MREEENRIMSRKMFLVLSLLVVLCMGLLGVTYAAWDGQALLVNGTVATGTFSVELHAGDVTKDTNSDGTCTALNGTGGTDDFTVVVSIGNVYDGFTCDIPIHVDNTGSVAVDVSAPALTWTDPDDEAAPGVTVDTADCWPNATQVQGGDSTLDNVTYVDCKITVVVDSDVEEGDSYSFHYDFAASQFTR